MREDIDKQTWLTKEARGQGVGVLFGTHNKESCDLILDELVKQGLARSEKNNVVTIDDQVSERITFGQLYGKLKSL